VQFFLATILIAGTITLSYPSFIIKGVNAQAQPYYGGGMDNNYQKSYEKDNKDKSKDSKSVSINKIKYINDNININCNYAGNISIGNKRQGYLGGYSLPVVVDMMVKDIASKIKALNV
jgi:hypothetical protein